MGDITDYFEAQPDDVRRFILKAMSDAGGDGRDKASVRMLMQERFGDRYAVDQLDTLWTAALWITR